MALRPISRMTDFEFPAGTWDVRGWTVRTAPDDKKVGRVDDMLLGREGELSYLEVDLGFMKKHVLVPLDRAHADRERESVWIEGVSKDRLEEAPEYVMEPETLDESYERRLHAYYGGTTTRPESEPARTAGDFREPERKRERERDAERAGEPVELRRMTELEKDYEVGGDDPRGWKVVTGEGDTVGRVAELLVAPGDMKARFLDVSVDEDALKLEPVDRHVLLPAERVRLEHSSKKVVVAGLLAPDLAEYPQYGGLPLTRGHARDIDDFFERAGRGATTPAPEDRETAADPTVSSGGHGPARHFYGAEGSHGTHRSAEAPPRRED